MNKAKYSDNKNIIVRCTEDYKKQAHMTVAAMGYDSLSDFIREKIDFEIEVMKKTLGPVYYEKWLKGDFIIPLSTIELFKMDRRIKKNNPKAYVNVKEQLRTYIRAIESDDFKEDWGNE